MVPPLEEPVAFIEEVDEADIVDQPLALIIFERPLVVGRPFVVERPPVVVEEAVAFIQEVDIVDEPLVLAVFEAPVFLEDEPANVNAPLVSPLWLYSFTISRD